MKQGSGVLRAAGSALLAAASLAACGDVSERDAGLGGAVLDTGEGHHLASTDAGSSGAAALTAGGSGGTPGGPQPADALPTTRVPDAGTSDESESSCRCASITRSPDGFYTIEHISLECGCGAGIAPCPASLDAALGAACADAGPTTRELSVRRGCGRVSLFTSDGFFSTEQVFDAATGVLTGVGWSSDSNEEPCDTFSTVAGQGFDCPDATQCGLCGPIDGRAAAGCL